MSAPAPDLLTRTEVLSKLRVAAPTLRRWCRASHFPEPLQLGPNCLRWVRADVEAWLASRRRVAAVIEAVPADRHRGRTPHTAASELRQQALDSCSSTARNALGARLSRVRQYLRACAPAGLDSIEPRGPGDQSGATFVEELGAIVDAGNGGAGRRLREQAGNDH